MAVYAVDGNDILNKLVGVPKQSPGAPMPILLATDNRCAIAYLCHDRESNRDIRFDDAKDETVAVIEFYRAIATYFGSPNDEALRGHPLYDRGLESYQAFEVMNSSWIRALEKMNRVHSRHRPEMFAGYRHFIWTFHDRLFECVARGFVAETFPGSTEQAIAKLKDKVLF